MKKTLVLLSLLFCFFAIQAQTNNSDNKLLVKYTQKELKKLKKHNPQEYEFARYCVDNAFYVAPSSKEKIADNTHKYGKINIKDISNINFFELNINLIQEKNQVFVINNSTKVLIVKSKEQILKELKK